MPSRKNKGAVVVLALGLVLLVGIISGLVLINRLSQGTERPGEEQTYKYHVAMIVADPTDIFWQSVYGSARTTGLDNDMYIENFGANQKESYALAERLEMAIAARVDGIIVEDDGSETVARLIAEAAQTGEKGIPVITVGSDAIDSARKSFVSENQYTLGEMYGRQILQAAEGQNQQVVALLTLNQQNAQSNLVYSAMSEVLAASTRNFKLSALITRENEEFEAEEKIRNLLLSGTSRPDLLVCLNAADTLSAYQCLVDYNLVGQVQVIGSYSTPDILDGIQKGIINSTIAVNAEEMGKRAAATMQQYLQQEYVSAFISVPTDLITQSNVGEFLEKEAADGEE